ncbi:MAG TPA: hypothetical protein VNJ04_02685 [Gemmatimonadaceae bacterium]|nr:hypothetical protein [Gemmatimonadaceae bacterium]
MRSMFCLSAALIALGAPLAQAAAQKAGRDVALDFRMSNLTTGTTTSEVVTGHVIATSDRVRLDMKGGGRGVRMSPIAGTGDISMIVTDSGKTLTYIDAASKTYMRMRPAEMIENMQKMGGMTMQFSGTEARVDNLGAGPSILGYPTAHYVVTTGMTIDMTAMGQQQKVQISSKTDYYFATGIASALNPFAAMMGSDMGSMFGGNNREFADKMRAAQSRLPKAIPLRTTTDATIIAAGQTRVTKTQTEVTAIKWLTADPKSFVVPADYKALSMPGAAVPNGS